jgi:uncharacterized protein (TIRG00374 family)
MFNNSKSHFAVNSLKAIISFIILLLLFKKLDLDAIIDNMAKSNFFFLFFASLFQVSIIVIQAIRWHMFFPRNDNKYNFRNLFKIFFIGTFFNNILPTSSGGDGVRAYYIYKSGAPIALSASPIIIERIIGLIAMIGMASLSIIFLDIEVEWINRLSSLMLFIFILLAIILLLIRWEVSYRILIKLFKNISRNVVINALLNMTKSINNYLNMEILMLKVFLISILAQIFQIIVFLLISYSLGIEISFFNLIFAVPIILIAAGLPISIGGFGVREVTIISVFSSMGISNIYAASIAFLFIPILIISSIPGLYFFINKKDQY